MEAIRLKIKATAGSWPIALLAFLLVTCQGKEQIASDYPSIQSDRDMENVLKQLTNWGKWGKDDELGTLNYITPQSIAAARELIKTGETITLARQVSIPNTPGIREPSYKMYQDDIACRDFIGSIWHGFAQTHLDALCHISADTLRLYNGFSTADISASGAIKLGIENMAERGIAGRGVLVDIGKAKGKNLSPGEPVYIKDIEEALNLQNIFVKEGDILLIRTGAGILNTREAHAGLHPECLFWIKDKKIALLGSDGDNDVHPLANFDRWGSAFHAVGIPYLGLPLLDNCELDALSSACEKNNRWEFFITISPWNLQGATSSPVSPLAIF